MRFSDGSLIHTGNHKRDALSKAEGGTLIYYCTSSLKEFGYERTACGFTNAQEENIRFSRIRRA